MIHGYTYLSSKNKRFIDRTGVSRAFYNHTSIPMVNKTRVSQVLMPREGNSCSTPPPPLKKKTIIKTPVSITA